MATPNQIVIDSPTNTVEIQTNDNQLTIISEVCNTEVTVTQPTVPTIQVATPGPKGDKGDTGDAGTAITNQITTGSITASVDIGTNTFRVQSGSSTYFYISSSSNIGIGTTTPTLGLLQLNSSATITNPSLYINAANVGTTASIIVRSSNGGAGGNQKTYNSVGGSDSLNFIQLLDADTTSTTNQPIGRIIFSSNDTDSGGTNTTKAFIEAVSEDTTPDTFLAFGTAQASISVTERMRITSVGNIGIGTTTPANTLEVSGGITATSITSSIISASTGVTGSLNVLNGHIKIDNGYKVLGDSNHLATYNYDSNFPSSTSASFGLINIGNVGSYITAREDNLFGSSTILQFFTQGSERARITAGGRLGINTITPGARLVVKGDSALSSGVTFQALNSSDTTLLYVRDDGNVGIGTTNPQTKLHISSSTSGLILEPTSSGTPGFAGRDGQFIFGSSGGNHFIYVYMAGAWRSSSLS